jgi:adenosylcobinamide-GDP ribazoletransferase
MVRQFLIAVQFLTRVPVPRSLAPTEEEIGRAAAYFPLVGILVGASAALVYAGLKSFLPPSTCVIAVLIFSALVTGAFHEDGLADALDGFGGGWTKERMLEIMRDSRVGTFGALGLALLVLAKYTLLSSLDWPHLWRTLIFAHTASRWTALPLAWWLPYVREQGQGKLVARRIGRRESLIGTATLLLVSLLFNWRERLFALAVVAIVVSLCGLYYRRRLGGITGDCLGAANQIVEVLVYAVASEL